MLITEDPDDLDGLDRMAARMEQLGRPYLLDSILAPINSGFAASLARYVEVRRRHPEAEMLMGIGNLTELTEADTTGVTALLIGFCQEVGIRAVLTTEVIGWARGAVRETVLAAQIMHLAQRQARPPKHIDSGLVTTRDESMRAPSEQELRAMQSADLRRQLPAVRRCRLAVRVQRRAVRPRDEHVRGVRAARRGRRRRTPSISARS